MQPISSNDPFNAYRVAGCTLCKYYWLARLGSVRSGVETVHESRFAAVAHAESTRTRGVRFTLVEMPALFFGCEAGDGRIGAVDGLMITESRQWAPMAAHGAVSLTRLDVRSVVASFLRDPASLLVRRTTSDMPVLVAPFHAWQSRSLGSRRALQWDCVNRKVAIDLSHLETLRMRFDQQVRQLSIGLSWSA
jgi:hypothetical protein